MSRPSSASFRSAATAMVDLPEPERPVSQTVDESVDVLIDYLRKEGYLG